MKRFEEDRYYVTSDPELRLIGTPGGLAQLRYQGRGPTYTKVGNKVKLVSKLASGRIKGHQEPSHGAFFIELL